MSYLVPCTSYARRLLSVALLLLLVGATVASAQARDRLDHRGKEFWIAYLPTDGDERFPTLAITVWCEKPTIGQLTYNRSGVPQLISIPLGNRAYTFILDTLELLLPDPRTQPISTRTVHLEFADEVTVYGVNTMRWSSDAFLALPKEALGRHHYVLSYPNTQKPATLSGSLGDADFPSQFGVVASENGTVVQINPTARINGQRDLEPVTVTLNKGQVFLAQAEGPTGADLTGSEIVASAPVVVYGSHQRTNIPFSEAVGRDHIIEQLPSIDRWRTHIMLTPHFQLPKTLPDDNLARIIAANNGTIISVDSVPLTTLQARQMLEIPLDRAKLITASGPILVAQYQHSTVDENFLRQFNDSVGDPFMMNVSAREQFDSAYAFESYATKDFFYHYINIVIPTERISSLMLDGMPLPAGTTFERIPKTSYSYTQLQVARGSHYIKARVPFGLYVYGFGTYNSYGYPGGLVLDPLFPDHKEPKVRAADTCGGMTGVAFDDSTFDFGMESLRLTGSTNVRLRTLPFNPGVDSIRFYLDLIDPYQDGLAQMVAVDTAGLDVHVEYPVKGFTVAVTATQQTPIVLDTLASLNGQRFCRTVKLYNYGKFPQTVAGLRFTPALPDITSPDVGGVIIPPGGEREFTICYQHTGDTSFTVEIAVDNGCLRRPIALLPLVSGIDSVPPKLEIVESQCLPDVLVDLVDVGLMNSGIAFIGQTRLENAELIVSPSLPVKATQLRIKRLDQRKDMIYSIVVRDAVGLDTTITDTVGGFTLSVERPTGERVGVIVNEEWQYRELTFGQRTCDTLYLENYGLLPLQLQRVRNLGNIEYSIPPEQLPIVLQPGERRGVAVCVTPRTINERIDTLAIDFGCGFETELVPLRTVVNPLDGIGVDRCGNHIRFDIGGPSKRNFLATPTPNPADGAIATITIGMTEAQPVTLALFDGQGTEILRMLSRDELPAGLTQIDARIDDLATGLYYVRMLTTSGEVMTEKLVISR